MASIDKVSVNNITYTLLEGLTLGINPDDDLLYLYLNGEPIGDGVDVSGGWQRYKIFNCMESKKLRCRTAESVNP